MAMEIPQEGRERIEAILEWSEWDGGIRHNIDKLWDKAVEITCNADDDYVEYIAMSSLVKLMELKVEIAGMIKGSDFNRYVEVNLPQLLFTINSFLRDKEEKAKEMAERRKEEEKRNPRLFQNPTLIP